MSTFHVHIYATDPELIRKVDEVLTLQKDLQQKAGKLMTGMERLEQAVAKEKTVEESLLAAFQGLAQQIRDAGTNETRLNALADSVEANAATMAAAVVAGTPADPGAPATV